MTWEKAFAREYSVQYCEVSIRANTEESVFIAEPINNLVCVPEQGNQAIYNEEKEVAREAARIEEHYGKPMDIEWAYDKAGKLHILQARPITTLD